MTNAPDIANELRDLRGHAPRIANIAGLVGLVGLAAGVAASFLGQRPDVAFRSYLLNYCFVLSLALGALFFVMIQHLTRAGWSVSLRRLAEFASAPLPLLALLFVPMLVPIFMGNPGVYPWSNVETVQGDALLRHKSAYLNAPFFLARCVVYFAVWSLLARYFLQQSTAQDATGDPQLSLRMGWWSAPGMLLYALTVSFFAIDALMSLDPHWFSTIYGVYFFSGATVGFFALLAVLIVAVQRAGRLRRSISVDHYHDVGKFAFGFVVFWAYIAFSQYMLIWYANLPEETVWYHARQSTPWWRGVSLLLLFGHFFAPFLLLMSRSPKRRPAVLAAAAVWLLIMHWVDLYYLVMPPGTHFDAGPLPLHVSDIAFLVGLGGLYVCAVFRPMARHALLPVRDPRLHESLSFQNI